MTVADVLAVGLVVDEPDKLKDREGIIATPDVAELPLV